MPLLTVWLLIAGVFTLCIYVREYATGAVLQLADWIAHASLWGLALSMLLWISVILLGRPKVLIPPPVRGHHGVLGEYLASLFRGVAWVMRRLRRAVRGSN